MNRGYVKLWRKTIDSQVFSNEGLLKVWVWCLLRANHKPAWATIKTGRGETEILLEPGQFIFGRHSAAKALRMNPSTVWKRILKLQSIGNLNIESDYQYSIITIVNWNSYQPPKNESDSESDYQVTTKEQPSDTEKNDKNDKKYIPEKILSLRERYSDQELINQAFNAIASIRKSGRAADSVLLSQLQKWGKYPIEQVESGIQTYLNKNCAADGKGEKYLLGIIRNQKPELSNPKSKTPEWL